MNKRILHLIGIALIVYGCNKYETVPVPGFGPNSILTQTYPLEEPSKHIMEGVYNVVSGADRFGDNVIVKWNRDKMSVFCGNGCYMILSVGYLDSVVMMQGYWRYAFGDATGHVTAYISKSEGGPDIIYGHSGFEKIIFRGVFGSTSDILDKPFVIQYIRPINPDMLDGSFDIVAHRSGGRTSDRLPVSENSIEMINYTGYFGSTGIEIDVQLTKDGIPVLYHDGDINVRLTQKGALTGPLNNFTYLQLYYYVRLIHGERIPKLEDALNFVVDSTDLRFVWLDMKDNVPGMSAVIPIQKKALERAKQQGRNLNIYIGMPTQATIEDFMNQPDYQNIPSLCELTLDDVRKVNARVWGPRWTEGTQNAEVEQMHAEGRKAYCWTIDNLSFIQQFINEGNFDGLLTNYPYLVAYYHYIR